MAHREPDLVSESAADEAQTTLQPEKRFNVDSMTAVNSSDATTVADGDVRLMKLVVAGKTGPFLSSQES